MALHYWPRRLAQQLQKNERGALQTRTFSTKTVFFFAPDLCVARPRLRYQARKKLLETQHQNLFKSEEGALQRAMQAGFHHPPNATADDVAKSHASFLPKLESGEHRL